MNKIEKNPLIFHFSILKKLNNIRKNLVKLRIKLIRSMKSSLIIKKILNNLLSSNKILKKVKKKDLRKRNNILCLKIYNKLKACLKIH